MEEPGASVHGVAKSQDMIERLSFFLLLPSGLHDCDGPDHEIVN